jgi:hypothetical protein
MSEAINTEAGGRLYRQPNQASSLLPRAIDIFLSWLAGMFIY